jgi:hypothetical protein
MRRKQYSVMGGALALLQAPLPTCVQGPINYPVHRGQPNPRHGWYYLAGSIPAACYDQESQHSHYYQTEQEAVDAVLAAGATHVQGADCRKVKWGN